MKSIKLVIQTDLTFSINAFSIGAIHDLLNYLFRVIAFSKKCQWENLNFMGYNKFKTDPFMTYPFSFKIWLNQAMIACIKKSPKMIISWYKFKVERILKGSLDLIPSPSPSVKIQIMGGKVCLRCKGKTLLGIVYKLLKTKSTFVDIT